LSRTLDDIEELVFPAAIALGGLYLVWWVTRVGIEQLSVDLLTVVGTTTAAGFNDLSGWVDDNVYTPGELADDIQSVGTNSRVLAALRNIAPFPLVPSWRPFA
jgi:hypothetical protein